MTIDRGLRVLLALCTTVLVAAALQAGQGVFAPIVFALFVIALLAVVR
jgi:predicted PurR-regulated permease PerM